MDSGSRRNDLAFCNPVIFGGRNRSVSTSSFSCTSFLQRFPCISSRSFQSVIVAHDSSITTNEDLTVNHHSTSTTTVPTSTTSNNTSSSPINITQSDTNVSINNGSITIDDLNNDTNNLNGTAEFLDADEIASLVECVENANITDFRFEEDNFSIEISCPGGLGFDNEGNLNSPPISNNNNNNNPALVSSPIQYVDDYIEDNNNEEIEETIINDQDNNNDNSIENEQDSSENNDEKDIDQVYDSDFIVTSNRVGFFFCGAKNKPPLVNIGDTVAYNQPVCIIEQLGQQYVYLSEAAGKVVKVFVEDGDAVEFGSKIMVIRPD